MLSVCRYQTAGASVSLSLTCTVQESSWVKVWSISSNIHIYAKPSSELASRMANELTWDQYSPIEESQTLLQHTWRFRYLSKDLILRRCPHSSGPLSALYLVNAIGCKFFVFFASFAKSVHFTAIAAILQNARHLNRGRSGSSWLNDSYSGGLLSLPAFSKEELNSAHWSMYKTQSNLRDPHLLHPAGITFGFLAKVNYSCEYIQEVFRTDEKTTTFPKKFLDVDPRAEISKDKENPWS